MAENSYKGAIKEAEADIDRIRLGIEGIGESINKLNTAVLDKLNKAFQTKSPQELANSMKQVDDATQKLNEKTAFLAKETEKLQRARQKLTTAYQQSKLEERITIKNAKEQAALNSKMVGAYDKLNIQLKRKARELRNLIAAEKQNSAEIKRATREFEQYRRRVNQANAATQNFAKGGLLGVTRGISNLLGAFGVAGGLYLFADMARQGFNLARKLDSLNFAMRTVITSSKELAETQAFLARISESYGAAIVTITERYTKFRAAAMQSNVTAKATQEIFESMTKAAGALGLQSHELEGVFLALEQMLSKGKVTTEELRRQLGERLPGAFGIMADALGVTVSQLDKMLRKGEILSHEALPLFAKAAEKAYGITNLKRVQNLNAATTRMSNAWVELIQRITNSEGTLNRVMVGVLDQVAKKLTAIGDGIEKVNNELSLAGNVYTKFESQLSSLGEEIGKLGQSFNHVKDQVKLLKWLFSLSIWEIWGEIIKAIATIFDSFGSAIKSVVADIRDFTSLIGAGKFLKAINSVGGATERMVDSFTGSWDRAYNSVKWNVDAIEKEMERFIAFNDTIRPFPEGKEEKWFDFANSYTPEEKTTPEEEEDKGKAGKRDKVDAFEVPDLNPMKSDSIGYYEAMISNLKKIQTNANLTKEEFDALTNQIESFESAISILDGSFDVKGLLELTDEEQIEMKDFLDAEGIEAGMKNLSNLLGADYAELMAEFASQYELDYEQYKEFEQKKIEARREALETQKELQAEFESAVRDLVVEGADAIMEARVEKVDEDIELNRERYAKILAAQEWSEEQRDAIEAERDLKEAKLEKKKRKREKEALLVKQGMALAEVAIEVAKGIATATAMAPATMGASLSWIPWIIGTGAAQAALIVAQTIPAFETGTDNAPEGIALVDEKRPEVHTDKHGNVKSWGQKGANLRYLEKGDKIYKSHDHFLNSTDMQRAVWDMNMQSAGQELSQSQVDNSLLREMSGMRGDLDKMGKRIAKLASRPISNNVKVQISDNKPY